jgi:hypothetical protein
MDELKQALQSTLHQLVVQMSEQVKHHALSDGWEPEVASALNVTHDGNNFSISIDDQYADRAFIHEFGDQDNAPKATLRKFGNQNGSAEATALALFDKFVSRVL